MNPAPHMTTAVIVERESRFLMVEERSGGQIVYNQPAGHVEPGESILAAARREALEETGWEVRLDHFLGFYTYLSPSNGVTYCRFCFTATPVRHLTTVLDQDIIAAHWLDLEAIEGHQEKLRSPLVLECIHHYLAGWRYPLDLIHEFHLEPQG